MPDLRTGEPMPDVPPHRRGRPSAIARQARQDARRLLNGPKDETPGCTIEACAFRDAYEDFVAAGAEVIGISRDDADKHAGFKAHHRLPFTLLTDTPSGSAATAFGVKKSLLGLLPGRVTFVIDKAGVVQHRFESQIRMGKHVDDALALVKRLAS